MELFDLIYDLYDFSFENSTDETLMWAQWVEDLGAKRLQCEEYNGTLVTLESTGCEETALDRFGRVLDLNAVIDVCVGLACSDISDYSDIFPLPKGCVLSFYYETSGVVSLVIAASTVLVMVVNLVALMV